MATDPDKTDPGLLDKAKAANAKADPWFDRALDALKGSAFTPWIIVVLMLFCVVFGAWVAW